jgi:hypothetical protein
MIIKDLKDKYPLVYEAAMKNCDPGKGENHGLMDAFYWVRSPEGEDFWNNINAGQFDRAKEICPHLFVESPVEFRVGDWVVVLPTDNWYFNAEQDKAQKLKQIRDDGLPYQLLFPDGSTNSYKHIRKATQAEIDKVIGVKSETMFKKGDYIVILNKPNGILDYLPPNYVYKQNRNYDCVYPDVDIKGTKTSCSDVKFVNKNDWRYATPEEIAEYDRLGKPFDVTTMNMETTSIDMEAIQAEAKRRFPIGCKFRNTDGGEYMLVQDDEVYKIVDNMIYASDCLGCLYKDGTWATLISMPETGVLNTSVLGDVGYVDASLKYDVVANESDYIVGVRSSTPQPLLLNKPTKQKQLVNLK